MFITGVLCTVCGAQVYLITELCIRELSIGIRELSISNREPL